MKRYNQLADLESLLLDIADSSIRAYAKEAIDCYFAGAYRASIVSIWIAVVLDLYQKIRYLSEQYSDTAAQRCITDIERIRNDPDKKQVSSWEREILNNAYTAIKMITETEFKHLKRIQEDRNSCAHPVLDSEGLLFQPSPELARIHIRTAIETLLSQPAIMGKASIDALERDVEGSYFPNEIEGIKTIVKNRHLINSDKYIENLFVFSLKKILFLELNNENLIEKYILVLFSINEECPHILKNIDRNKLTSLFDKIKEERFQYLHELLKVKGVWNNTSDSLKEKFKTYIKNQIDGDGKALAFTILFEFNETENDNVIANNEALVSNYTTLSHKDKIAFLRTSVELGILNSTSNFSQKIMEVNIDIFTNSRSFASGRSNGSNFIEPFENLFTENLIHELLDKSIQNQKEDKHNQLENCQYIFIEIFNSTIDKYPKTLEKWQWFIQQGTLTAYWDNLRAKIKPIKNEDE